MNKVSTELLQRVLLKKDFVTQTVRDYNASTIITHLLYEIRIAAYSVYARLDLSGSWSPSHELDRGEPLVHSFDHKSRLISRRNEMVTVYREVSDA